MNETKLLNIYGARESTQGNGINITLVCGEGEQKQYFTAYVSFDTKRKCHAEVTKDGNFAVLIGKLNPIKKQEYKKEEAKTEDVSAEDLPF